MGDDDNWYRNLYNAVEDDPEKYLDFRIENGKLFKFVSSKSDVLDYRFEWKECVPESAREQVMRQEHDGCLHIGFEKCIEKLKRRFYWPRMSAELKKYINRCDTCKETKHSTVSTEPMMGQQRVAVRPFQIVCMDYIQSLPRSKKGNAHLLVVLDVFSKYCLLAPVRKISSASLCSILEEQWLRKLSVPQYIITDNATTFLSKEFQDLLKRYGIQHWANARHRSQANPTERLNRTINAMIRTYVRQDQRLWDTKISEIEFILNNTVHATTKFTPHRVVFGHEAVTRGMDHQLEDDEELTEQERMERMHGVSKKTYELVKENLQKAHESTKRQYDLRHKRYSPVFDVGQRVFKRSFQQSAANKSFNAKLGPTYVPCIIVAKKGTSSYEVSDMNGRSLGVFSAADLKA